MPVRDSYEPSTLNNTFLQIALPVTSGDDTIICSKSFSYLMEKYSDVGHDKRYFTTYENEKNIFLNELKEIPV